MICSQCGSQMTVKEEIDHGGGRITIVYVCPLDGNESWSDVYTGPDEDEQDS